MFYRIAARDLVIIAITASAWLLAAPLSAGDGPVSDLTGLLIGLAIGVCAYLLHEWGHLTGALLSGSEVRAPERWSNISLFSFDSQKNSRNQFLVMSFAGFFMTFVAVWVTQGLLPDGQLASRVARGGVLFLAFLTVFVEFPLVIYALLRPALPPVETFASHRRDQRRESSAEPRSGETPVSA